MKEKERKELIIKRGSKCENCGITEWLGQPIKLEVHHIDGNHQNDKEDNLMILCPNCHSYTSKHSKNIKRTKVSDEEMLNALKGASSIHQALLNLNMSTAGANYSRARNMVQQYELKHLYKKEKTQKYCVDCGAPIDSQATRCRKCYQKQNRSYEINRDELKKMIRTLSFVEIGKRFNVTDNAIRKRCKTLGLPYRKKDIKQYSDEEWEKI